MLLSKKKIVGAVKLIRWHQWYKNLVVFIAVFFAHELMNLELVVKSLLAFISLCLISSVNYIINDIKDVEEDRMHPEKRKRPLPSGLISIREAYILALLLFIASILVAYSISESFILFPLVLFLNTTAYSYRLRQVPILDIHIIALNFVLRAVAGAYAIERRVSPWLVVVVFFIALLLAVGKRKGDYVVSKGKTRRSVYDVYTPEFMNSLLIMLASCLLISYSIYTFNSPVGERMMLTIPFASFLIFRYYHLAVRGARAGRSAEYLFKDLPWISAFILWGLTCFIILYT